MSTFLVTGAAGTLGSLVCRKLMQQGHYVRAMDINECALAGMNFNPEKFTKIYGDISDYRRCYKALKGVDVLIHAAALKNISVTETNSEDVIRVNVNGTQNLASAAIERGVKHAIFISSDKAVEPTTLYGSSKQVGEHIWKSASRIQNKTQFTIIRSGNFWESNGNFMEIWKQQKEKGLPITITDMDMWRHFINAEEVADLVLDLNGITDPKYDKEPAINCYTFIPKMQEYNIFEIMLQMFGENQEFIVTGRRQGEKLHERLKMEDEIPVLHTNKFEVVR